MIRIITRENTLESLQHQFLLGTEVSQLWKQSVSEPPLDKAPAKISCSFQGKKKEGKSVEYTTTYSNR